MRQTKLSPYWSKSFSDFVDNDGVTKCLSILVEKDGVKNALVFAML